MIQAATQQAAPVPVLQKQVKTKALKKSCPLMSPDNNVRGQAEAAFNQAKDKPDLLMGGLITLLRTNQAEQVCTARHRA